MTATPRVPNAIGEQKYPFLSNHELAITAHAGGTQAAAYALTAQISVVTTVATAGDSVALPEIVPNPGVLGSLGSILFVVNGSANAMQVYGTSTDTINAVATATGISVAPGECVFFVATSFTQSTGVGTWRATSVDSLMSGGALAGAFTTLQASSSFGIFGALMTSQISALTTVGAAVLSTAQTLNLTTTQLSALVTNNDKIASALHQLGIST